MAGIKSQVISLLLAAFIASSSAASSIVRKRQVPLSNGAQQPFRLGGDSQSAKVKYYMFDNIWLGGEANATYHEDDFLAFSHFGIVDADTAHEKGFLHAKDMDCAASKPHALFTWPNNFTTPSVIRSNATALAAAGLSEFFDIIAVSWKPLGPAPHFTSIELDAWRVEGGEQSAGGERKATLVSSLVEFWFGEEGETHSFLPPSTLQPGEWWEGWGEGVNWIEIDAKTEEGGRWDFCLDNLLLLFHGKE